MRWFRALEISAGHHEPQNSRRILRASHSDRGASFVIVVSHAFYL